MKGTRLRVPLLLALTGFAFGQAHAAAKVTADPAHAAVEQLVADYIGLYTGPTLEQ